MSFSPSELIQQAAETLESSRHALRRRLTVHPSLYMPYARWRHSDSALRAETDVVIDGFMRSANTFAVVAFQLAQNDHVRVAHHLHAAAHLMEAASRRVPTLVPIREPEPTILSALQYIPQVTARQWLLSYASFYERISELRDQVVIATFEDVTSDFGNVTERVNERFGTNFRAFDHTPDHVGTVFALIAERSQGPPWGGRIRQFLSGFISAEEFWEATAADRAATSAERLQPIPELRVARPSAVRGRAKAEHRDRFSDPALAPLRARAERAYLDASSDREPVRQTIGSAISARALVDQTQALAEPRWQVGPVASARRSVSRQVSWARRRVDPRSPRGLLLSFAVVVAALCGWFFGGVTQDVVAHEEIVRIDPRLAWLIAAHRVAWVTGVMRAATWLGSNALLIPLVLVVGGYFIARRRDWRPLGRLGTSLVGAVLLYDIVKPLVRQPGPPGRLDVGYAFTRFAFPSGRVVEAMAVWGMLALVVAGAINRRRYVPLMASALIVLLVGASTLYLGAHWLSDVLGAYALGGLWLSILVVVMLARSKRRTEDRFLTQMM